MSIFSFISTVNVRKDFLNIQRAGFGIPMLLGYHTAWADNIRFYNSHTEMLSDGFTTSDALYRAAQALTSQSPSVARFAVGRLGAAPAQTVNAYPVNVTEGYVYSITFSNGAATETATYTVQNGDAVEDIVDGLVLAVNAFTSIPMTASDNATHVRLIPDTVGDVITLTDFPELPDMGIQDITADTSPSITDSLNAIATENNTWYQILPVNSSLAVTAVLRTYADANEKTVVVETADRNVPDAGDSTDIVSVNTASSTERVKVIFTPSVAGFAHMRLASICLSFDPGSVDWANQRLRGIPGSNISQGRMQNVFDKGGAVYAELASGLSVVLKGQAGTEYMDVTRGLDWAKDELQKAISSLLISAPKIPYTNQGRTAIIIVAQGVVDLAVERGVFSPGNPEDENDPVPLITVPLVGDQTQSDRANRIFRDVQISARLAGAIREVVSTISVTV